MDVALELEALVVELSLCLERRGLNDCSRNGVLEARLAVGARGRAPERLGVWPRVPVWQRVGAANEGDERQAAIRVQLVDELLPAGDGDVGCADHGRICGGLDGAELGAVPITRQEELLEGERAAWEAKDAPKSVPL